MRAYTRTLVRVKGFRPWISVRAAWPPPPDVAAPRPDEMGSSCVVRRRLCFSAQLPQGGPALAEGVPGLWVQIDGPDSSGSA